MRTKLIWGALALAGLIGLGAGLGRMPIRNGYLQTGFDGNNQAATNFATVSAAAFLDALTGTPIAGSGVSNLSGTVITDGTIETNKLTTNAYAVLLGGGGDTVALSNNLTANFNAQVSALTPPFVTVMTNGSYVAGGVLYSPTNTTTCGIQEAIYWLLQGTNENRGYGGTIYLGPGTYWTTETIRIPGEIGRAHV